MRVAKVSYLVFALAQVVSLAPAVAQPAPEAAPAEPAPAETAAPAEPAPAPEPAPAAAAPPPAAAPVTEYVPGARPAPSPFKIETPNSTLKLGVLLQPQYEIAGSTTLDSVSHNLFVRRVRFLVGATLFKNIEFFFDTDYPDLFKAAPETGTKNTPGMNVQDAFGTFKVLEDAFKVDMGYMLPPSTHNANQGAGTLYSWDYFTNSFRNSASFNSSGNPVGRDAGIQVRGLVLDNLLEYRAGLFQGRRNDSSPTSVQARNFFRVAARLQVNVFEPETGFFYAGTYLGTKRVLSFGGTIDFQDDYIHYGGDAFLDMPLGPGVLTAQVNVAHYDGGDFLIPGGISTPLADQSSVMGELGFLFNDFDLSPIFRFEQQWLNDNDATETRVGGGVAFWPYGHAFNLKAFYQRVTPDVPNTIGLHGFDQFNLQAQVYVF